jgi:AraC-like DNA-binding protein
LTTEFASGIGHGGEDAGRNDLPLDFGEPNSSLLSPNEWAGVNCNWTRDGGPGIRERIGFALSSGSVEFSLFLRAPNRKRALWTHRFPYFVTWRERIHPHTDLSCTLDPPTPPSKDGTTRIQLTKYYPLPALENIMGTTERRRDSSDHPILKQQELVALNLPPKAGKVDRRVEVAIALLTKYQNHRQLSVNDLAAHVHLSPSRLRQLFKARTGISPAKYRRVLRLERAKLLLENSFLSVKEIVGEIGYGDISHFVRDFRFRYNVRPVEARSLSTGTFPHRLPKDYR